MGDFRLLIYTQTFAPNIGGVETYVRALAEGLSARGVFTTVATLTPKANHDDGEHSFRIVRLPRLNALRNEIATADVLHVAGAALAPMWWAWRGSVPFVVEHHNYQAICPNGLLLRLPQRQMCDGRYMRGDRRACRRCLAAEVGGAESLKRLSAMPPRRWLLRRAAAQIAVSRHVASRIAMPATTIYHGLSPVEPVAKPSPSNGALEFAYVGRLVAEKGVALLLRAMAVLREGGVACRLAVVGDGPLRDDLQRQAEALGVADVTRFTGWVAAGALDAALATADVLVMPSIWEETAGLAAMEQLWRGRPVIAAAVGGLREIVGEAGLTFEPNDVAGLTEAMRHCCERRETLPEIAAAGRARAQRLFAVGRMVDEHLQLYRDVLARGGRA